MKRMWKALAGVVAAVAVLATSGVGWYAYSEPPHARQVLAADLVDANLPQGRQLLATAESRNDYSQLDPYFVPQARKAFCGVATSAMVINATLHDRAFTQGRVFSVQASAVRSELAVTFRGMTLDQLAGILRAHGLRVEVAHAAQSDLTSFREAARATLADASRFIVVNYDRASVGQVGGGHISPLGAYHAATDRVLVLDVAAHHYPYTWVPVAKLFNAMNTVDRDSGQTRGYLLVTAAPAR